MDDCDGDGAVGVALHTNPNLDFVIHYVQNI